MRHMVILAATRDGGVEKLGRTPQPCADGSRPPEFTPNAMIGHWPVSELNKYTFGEGSLLSGWAPVSLYRNRNCYPSRGAQVATYCVGAW